METEPRAIPKSQLPRTRTFVLNQRPHTNASDMPEVVEEFHQYYLEQRKAMRVDYKQIFREFRKNKDIEGVWFNPYFNMLEGYFRRWEKELPVTMRHINIKKRDLPKKGVDDAATLLKEVSYNELEDGAKTLQGMLIDDGLKLLRESNEEYEAIDENGGMWNKEDWEKIRIAKKKVALSIGKEVLAGVHRFELLKIKKNQEGRETASFMMDLVRRSTAGEVSDEEMQVLDTVTK